MTTKQMALGLVVMVVVLCGCMAVAFRLGRSSAVANAAPTVAGAATSPAAPDPKLAALDNSIEQYNINLRQIDQDEQKTHDAEQEQDEQAKSAANDPRIGTAIIHQELAILQEKNALGVSTATLYRQIQSDPAFSANYRETTYNSTHGLYVAAWTNLRYIERR